jgi:hypothetical protein
MATRVDSKLCQLVAMIASLGAMLRTSHAYSQGVAAIDDLRELLLKKVKGGKGSGLRPAASHSRKRHQK